MVRRKVPNASEMPPATPVKPEPAVRLQYGRTSVRLEPWMVEALERRARALNASIEAAGGKPGAVNFSAALRDALAAELRRGEPDADYRSGFATGFLAGLAKEKKQFGIALAGLSSAREAPVEAPASDPEVEL